jgi:hypothetical protein
MPERRYKICDCPTEVGAITCFCLIPTADELKIFWPVSEDLDPDAHAALVREAQRLERSEQDAYRKQPTVSWAEATQL